MTSSSDQSIRMVTLPGGPTLAVKIRGSGPITVFFLHGYSMSLDAWDRAIDLMPSAFTAYCYDLRGFGRSGRAASYSLDDHAADLPLLMSVLGIESAALVGHSLGSNVIQMAAMNSPGRARALVLTNGRSLSLPPPDRVLGAVEERIRRYGSVEDNRAVLAGRIAGYFDPRNVSQADIDRFLELGLLADTGALRQTLDCLYSMPATPAARFAAIESPVLLVCGETDHVTPIEVSEPALRVFTNAKMITIPGSGHTPMWEKPVEWSAGVFGFLQQALAG